MFCGGGGCDSCWPLSSFLLARRQSPHLLSGSEEGSARLLGWLDNNPTLPTHCQHIQ